MEFDDKDTIIASTRLRHFHSQQSTYIGIRIHISRAKAGLTKPGVWSCNLQLTTYYLQISIS